MKNKGFIVFSLAIWCTIILCTLISLQSAWSTALLYKDMYERERIYLANVTSRCIEHAYGLYISGIGKDTFVYRDGEAVCWGKTGETLYATTTDSRFWYATSTKI